MDHRNPDTWAPEFAREIERVREYVATLHADLPRWGLVVWTAGNVSQRVRGEAEDGSQDLLVIKPSGVSYDDLSPEAMVVCDLDGNLVLGEGSPSSDTAAHAYVYRHMSEVGGVVHTHSTYATAWAARGEEIPCVLTMMGDEFGGPVPVGPFALIGDDSIGRGIVETLRDSQPRPLHDRARRTCCRQGRRHGRGGRQDRARCAGGRASCFHRTASHRLPLRSLPKRLRTALTSKEISP